MLINYPSVITTICTHQKILEDIISKTEMYSLGSSDNFDSPIDLTLDKVFKTLEIHSNKYPISKMGQSEVVKRDKDFIPCRVQLRTELIQLQSLLMDYYSKHTCEVPKILMSERMNEHDDWRSFYDIKEKISCADNYSIHELALVYGMIITKAKNDRLFYLKKLVCQNSSPNEIHRMIVNAINLELKYRGGHYTKPRYAQYKSILGGYSKTRQKMVMISGSVGAFLSLAGAIYFWSLFPAIVSLIVIGLSLSGLKMLNSLRLYEHFLLTCRRFVLNTFGELAADGIHLFQSENLERLVVLKRILNSKADDSERYLSHQKPTIFGLLNNLFIPKEDGVDDLQATRLNKGF